jgi:hypothetical protein
VAHAVTNLRTSSFVRQPDETSYFPFMRTSRVVSLLLPFGLPFFFGTYCFSPCHAATFCGIGSRSDFAT